MVLRAWMSVYCCAHLPEPHVWRTNQVVNVLLLCMFAYVLFDCFACIRIQLWTTSVVLRYLLSSLWHTLYAAVGQWSATLAQAHLLKA